VLLCSALAAVSVRKRDNFRQIVGNRTLLYPSASLLFSAFAHSFAARTKFAHLQEEMSEGLITETRQRAQFDALRRRAFAETLRNASRWRLAWSVPLNLFVLGVMWLRGASATRCSVQALAIALYVITLAIARRRDRGPARIFVIGSLCYFISVANTGGLASPLLVTGVPLLVGAALTPLNKHHRRAIFFKFFGFFVLIALLSHTHFGAFVAPLAPDGLWSSTEYTLVALASLAITAFGVYNVGQRVAHAYEDVAFELVARREELCVEGEDRSRALEGIAARLAHEVKNPLAAIRGLTAHMAKNIEDPKSRERLEIVAAEAERLQGIVDGFLSFSRGFDDLKVEPTRPHTIANELSLLLETRAEDLGISIEVKGSPDLVLLADPQKLRQALLNLMLNAMQASPSGKVVSIEIAKSCDGAATIRIIDRGAGMPPEVLDRIQKPYFTTKAGGSGLGIAVARGLIEQHGGSLRFESAVGRGTSAIVDLPPSAEARCMGQKLPALSSAAPAPVVVPG